MGTTENGNMLFPQGEKAPADYFTGTAWVKILVPQDETGTYSIGDVVFEPGSRNNWHTHPAGQILLVTAGKGYYQEKGKPARLLTKGDVVVIPSGVVHWHGATRDSRFIHIAITNNTKDGAVKWLERVTDEEYDRVHQTGDDDPPPAVKLTETAIHNHKMLFPHDVSKLKETDPELIEVFNNFAYDEVVSYGGLDTRTRMVAIVASTIACQALSEFTFMANGALNAGVTPVELKEIVYQAVPYVGIAKVLDFIHATNEILQRRGVTLPLEKQTTTSRENRQEKGLAVQRSIFGDRIDKMYQEAPTDQLHIQQYLSANCFGDYITRKGLDLKTRELITYAMLISLGGVEAQVKGHVRGNVNVGNDKATLLSVTTQLLPYIGYPRTLNALQCLNEVIPD
ncbi:(R)-mandelonitrile lyase [Chitinophaga flava]|uniref:4-carboxymuconolactone decarboxylase n=1 Tax=Chitinophaga flava TaxID=2259036 RepID=A0A365XX59_9BACT|nr:carboxymuconolactone decarboxylase family protein [Chitinophaga flava]RBL90927.1 4-carboxymuconolactone decarboxylase [Chitinophaga flava]